MRWLGFAICAVIVLTLQTTVAWRLELGGARPDWMLVLAVFFAMHARSMDALIGVWLLGAVADVMSIERFGLMSGCYAVTMVAVYATREYVFRDSVLIQFIFTFAPAAAIGVAQILYRAAAVDGAGAGLMGEGRSILFGAAYTAAWAPLLHWVLLKFPDALGIRRPQRSYRGRRMPRASDV